MVAAEAECKVAIKGCSANAGGGGAYDVAGQSRWLKGILTHPPPGQDHRCLHSLAQPHRSSALAPLGLKQMAGEFRHRRGQRDAIPGPLSLNATLLRGVRRVLSRRHRAADPMQLVRRSLRRCVGR